MTEDIRESRLFVCDLCQFEDAFNNAEDTMECPFCRHGTLRVVPKEEVGKARKAFGL